MSRPATPVPSVPEEAMSRPLVELADLVGEVDGDVVQLLFDARRRQVQDTRLLVDQHGLAAIVPGCELAAA